MPTLSYEWILESVLLKNVNWWRLVIDKFEMVYVGDNALWQNSEYNLIDQSIFVFIQIWKNLLVHECRSQSTSTLIILFVCLSKWIANFCQSLIRVAASKITIHPQIWCQPVNHSCFLGIGRSCHLFLNLFDTMFENQLDVKTTSTPR